MAATTASMHLHSLTLHAPTAAVHAVVGNFSGVPKAQDIAIARPTSISIVRVIVSPDDSARLVPLIDVPLFASVRSIAAFRVTGGHKDYIVVGSDAGTITILEYLPEQNRCARVHCETFGRSGVRRIVPGEYLASDPKGRAVMIAALEKQKFVYVLNRDAATHLTISSPLEAHKASTLTLALTGLDVDFDNPVFASLEVDYSAVDKAAAAGNPVPPYVDRFLVYYELDLGLNHVVRKRADPVDPTSHHLIAVPGGSDGPGGVLVCAENWIAYRSPLGPAIELRCPLPRRVNYLEDANRGLVVVASVVHRLKNRFLILVQSDEGDVYRVSLDVDPAAAGPDAPAVVDVRVKYFDTLAIATSLLVLRAGYLVALSEAGTSWVLRIDDLGDADAETPEVSASADGISDEPVYFRPRDLTNLSPVGAVDALHPLACSHFVAAGVIPGEPAPHLYTAVGRGARSTLRAVRPGIEGGELAVTEVPERPTGVWTIKSRVADAYDAYIVASFVQSTVVFAVGETVEEVYDSGLALDVRTLYVHHMGIDDMVQVHPGGVRHIKGASSSSGSTTSSTGTTGTAGGGKLYEWRAPFGRVVTCAAANARQVLLSLQGGELVYFELDMVTGLLNEYPQHHTMSAAVTCLDMGAVPVGRLRARYAAVGCVDATVRVLSLEPTECLEPQAMQALNAVPESLCTVDMLSGGAGGAGANVAVSYLHIGLANGVLIRSVVDPTSGELGDTRLRFLGPRAAKLVRVRAGGANGMLALSTRPWLSYTTLGKQFTQPVQYRGDLSSGSGCLDLAAGFATEAYPEAVVSASGTTIRIWIPDRLGMSATMHPIIGSGSSAAMLQDGENEAAEDAGSAVASLLQHPGLDYSPRALAVHPTSQYVVVAEGDQNVYHAAEAAMHLKAKADEFDDPSIEQYCDEFPAFRYGPMRAGRGKWASQLRVVCPAGVTGPGFSAESVQVLALGPDEVALSMALVPFPPTTAAGGAQPPNGTAATDGNHDPDGMHLVVGTVTGLEYPRTFRAAHLRTYRFVDGGTRLEFLHATDMDAIPRAVAAFHGRVMVGAGRALRIYELGRKRLLRKAEAPNVVPTLVTWLGVQGARVWVADLEQSVCVAMYRPTDQRIVVFADDAVARWVTAAVLLDYDSIAVADKFGTLAVLRVPRALSKEIDDDPTGNRVLYDRPMLNGAPHKLESVCEWFAGDQITNLHVGALTVGGRETIVYSGLSGTVGVMVPLMSKDDVDFFAALEVAMRGEASAAGLVGRDHLKFRGMFKPVKGVTDGDLCEQFLSLSSDAKQDIANELDRPVQEIVKRIEDLRARSAF
ncbi:CPSF A subunit region-domain-containing protein [Blastocladiella britannica]|nr:CPSF A subunit region-domain-containing protein [Blastocladiella britannica]